MGAFIPGLALRHSSTSPVSASIFSLDSGSMNSSAPSHHLFYIPN